MNPIVLSIVEVLVTIFVLAAGINVFSRASSLFFDRVKSRQNDRAQVDDDRLSHLERAVDAIALEVERISEGQRFTTKLLAEREAEAPRKFD